MFLNLDSYLMRLANQNNVLLIKAGWKWSFVCGLLGYQ